MRLSAPWTRAERPKVLVLLTDGEDLEKGGVRTAEALAKQGVVVFTVGVGTPAGAEIQILNEQGKPELVRDSRGEVVRSRLDETTLRAIAQATHGAYYPLGPLGEGLAKVRLRAREPERGLRLGPGAQVGRGPFPLARGGGAGLAGGRIFDWHPAPAARHCLLNSL